MLIEQSTSSGICATSDSTESTSAQDLNYSSEREDRELFTAR
jgi:hypothetical protein